MSVGPTGLLPRAAVRGNGDWAGARDLVERPNACIRTSRGEPLVPCRRDGADTLELASPLGPPLPGVGSCWPSIRVSKGWTLREIATRVAMILASRGPAKTTA